MWKVNKLSRIDVNGSSYCFVVCHFRWLHSNPIQANPSKSRHCWLVPKSSQTFRVFLSSFYGFSASFSFSKDVFCSFPLRNFIKSFNEIQLSDNGANWISIQNKRWKFLARFGAIIAGNKDVHTRDCFKATEIIESSTMIFRLDCIIGDSLDL